MKTVYQNISSGKKEEQEDLWRLKFIELEEEYQRLYEAYSDIENNPGFQ